MDSSVFTIDVFLAGEEDVGGSISVAVFVERLRFCGMKFCEEAVEKASSISAIEGIVAEKIEAGLDEGVLGDLLLPSLGEVS